ncbi:hypothetical protein PCNPT3_04955 [Psychromonas sp. CNPT3]|uniref:FeoB-associated Cys-rich membrane protein n=1 Tax=Psychromonas sp. CNPT3 TaxID=314282 RepID=UPI00006E9E32|nr:FeoB-associated Cys-rich membrane protein [Psychromonas sp. CNPT3]AGH80933.1 hypothetical protein PCNPT3_04955 [Psychromonas sp. CNPT3]
MLNIIVLFVIGLILALSISKIVADKRRGVKCIGCSLSSQCDSPPVKHKMADKTQTIKIKQII